MNGKVVHIKSPKDAVAHGIGYLSEDRKRYGLALGMDVEENIALAGFSKFVSKLGTVNRSATREDRHIITSRPCRSRPPASSSGCATSLAATSKRWSSASG